MEEGRQEAVFAQELMQHCRLPHDWATSSACCHREVCCLLVITVSIDAMQVGIRWV